MTWNVDQLGHRLIQRFFDTKDDKERELIEALLSYYEKRDSTPTETTIVEVAE